MRHTAKRRPAETTSALAAVTTAVVTLLGVNLSQDQFTALIVLIGFVPAVVTWIATQVNNRSRP